MANVAHYGSPAGELSACIRAVGLADRSDLVKLELAGEPETLAAVVERGCGSRLAVGGTAEVRGAWWCAAAQDRVVVLAEPACRAALLTAVQAPGVKVADRSATWSAIALVGRLTGDVLTAVGAHADARLAPPFGQTAIAGLPVSLLLPSDRRALLVADADHESELWRRISAAGYEFGLSYVGVEAAVRYALVDVGLVRALP
jgi:glycine cleavage system aminomethyltransferase T